jgi:hypothetical protein
MDLEEIYNQLEKLNNNLEFYQNRLDKLKCLVMPKATQYDKVMVDGGKRVDNILKYVELEDEQKLTDTILYIKGKIDDLNILKEKELERLTKYGEGIKAVVILKECEFIEEYGKKRHLTWQEIADKLYCSKRTAINWYNLVIKDRKRVL